MPTKIAEAFVELDARTEPLRRDLNRAESRTRRSTQRMSQGFVVPARFTHGTSAQRVRWFKAGLLTGDMNACQQLFDLEYSEL